MSEENIYCVGPTFFRGSVDGGHSLLIWYRHVGVVGEQLVNQHSKIVGS
jgi:hypothetical protein